MENESKLLAIMRDRRCTNTELAQAVGVSRTAVQKWINGTPPTLENLVKVAKYLKVDISDLVNIGDKEQQSEQEEKHLTPNFQMVRDSGTEVKEGWVRVPLLDFYASCGPDPTCPDCSGEIIGEADFASAFLRSLPGVIRVKDNFAIVTAKGDSMEPTIMRSGFCLVDTRQTDLNIDGIFCLYADGAYFIKRIQLNLDRSLTLLSDNPHYPPQVIQRSLLDNAKVVGRIIYIFNGTLA